MRGNTYTFFFITIVCIACALVVAGAASALKEQQEFSEKIDTYKNVLLAAGLIERGASVSPAEVEKLYKDGIAGILVDTKGEVVSNETNLTPEAVLKQDKILKGTPGYIEKEKRTYPLYTVSKGGKLDAFIVPVYGKGLWSDLFGYLSLEADGKTIRHLVFYKEGETPGLGKEITKPWFQDQFVKKTFLNEASEITFTVGRPSTTPYPNPTEVGGISGATITGRGVQKMIMDMMSLYRPYFEKMVWSKS
jgi:Na+-transporting NADH:ubiquinone oxidoreductase subunit C